MNLKSGLVKWFIKVKGSRMIKEILTAKKAEGSRTNYVVLILAALGALRYFDLIDDKTLGVLLTGVAGTGLQTAKVHKNKEGKAYDKKGRVA